MLMHVKAHMVSCCGSCEQRATQGLYFHYGIMKLMSVNYTCVVSKLLPRTCVILVHCFFYPGANVPFFFLFSFLMSGLLCITWSLVGISAYQWQC